jgi:hypothetical protein
MMSNDVSVETFSWRADVGVGQDQMYRLVLQGEYEVTWMDTGDLVLTFGFDEGEELPHLLRMLALAMNESALMGESE